MSKRNKDKGRLAPFVPLLKETIASPAWCAMSPAARCVYIALKQRYSQNFRNNGKLYLSTRKAAEEVGITSRATITQCFREMQHYGFVVQTSPGFLGVEGKGKAPHWRLTEIGYMADPPTKDFLSWNGKPFSAKSKRGFANPALRKYRRNPTRIMGREKNIPDHDTVQGGPRHSPLLDHDTVHSNPQVDHDTVHMADPRWTTTQSITSLTTWAARAGSKEGELQPPAHAPIGHNAGPPLEPEWTTPVLTETEYTPALRRLYRDTEPTLKRARKLAKQFGYVIGTPRAT
jgi:hypothetical protein